MKTKEDEPVGHERKTLEELSKESDEVASYAEGVLKRGSATDLGIKTNNQHTPIDDILNSKADVLENSQDVDNHISNQGENKEKIVLKAVVSNGLDNIKKPLESAQKKEKSRRNKNPLITSTMNNRSSKNDAVSIFEPLHKRELEAENDNRRYDEKRRKNHQECKKTSLNYLSFDEIVNEMDTYVDNIKNAETKEELEVFKLRHMKTKNLWPVLNEMQLNKIAEKYFEIMIYRNQKLLEFCISNFIKSYQEKAEESLKEKRIDQYNIANTTAEKFKALSKEISEYIYSKETLIYTDYKIEMIQSENSKLESESVKKYPLIQSHVSSTTTIAQSPASFNSKTIESHISIFKDKVKSLKSRECSQEAINSAQDIVSQLETYLKSLKEPSTLEIAKQGLSKAITKAHETLDNHRGSKQILLAGLSAIGKLFCGASFKNLHHYSFFKTDSHKCLDKVYQDLIKPTATTHMV